MKPRKRLNRRASGEEFAALMEGYGLRSNRGAELVADLLYLQVNTVQKAYKLGILRTELNYLKLELERLAQQSGFDPADDYGDISESP